MKHFLTLALVGIALQASAVDRIVEEFGVPPAYANIAAAVSAAIDGDRIIIKNRAGDVPWIETINVNKSLEFLSFQDNGFFIVQGQWTMTGANGRVIRIIGMHNTSGSIIAAGTGSVAGARVSIIDSRFVQGNVQLNSDIFKVDVVGSTFLNGYVHLSFGNVIGCEMTSASGNDLIRYTPSSTAFQSDTAAVMGNIVLNTSTSGNGILCNTRAQVVHVRNNWVRHMNNGINVMGGNTQGVQNLVWNNTVQTTHTGTSHAIYLNSTASGSVWEVMNNVITAGAVGTRRGIYNGGGNSGQINVYWNVVDAGMTVTISPTGFTFVGNNTTDQPVTLEADGSLPPGSPAIDGVNPAAPFYDLDLSFGDGGAYGGSYTLDNFHPKHTGAARVYLAGHPYNIREGATLRVKANAWDR